MSIFPVRIKEWYGNPEHSFYSEKGMLKTMLPFLECSECGEPVTFQKGYVMHSITFGGPDNAYCSKKCFNKEK